MKEPPETRARAQRRYLWSLPEGVVRALAAGLGGAVHQITLLILPGWLRRSRFYQATIERLLRIVIELLGGVEGAFPPEAIPIRECQARVPSLSPGGGSPS